MSIPVLIPSLLREYCGDRSEFFVTPGTVRDALLELQRHHPALHRCVCDDTGAVRRHVNLFVNDDFLRDRNGLDTVLVSGDVLSIYPAVSGG